jgi:type II secretory pathway component GspD/PulD (secretin)
LGDIPLIKYLFRNTYDVVNKKEIIIFITPRIISPEQSSVFRGKADTMEREQKMMDLINTKEKEEKYK